MEMVSACLHKIDVTNNEVREIAIDSSNEDLRTYLSNLLHEIDPSQQKRKFSFVRDTTEPYLLLRNIANRRTVVEFGASLAQRLLAKEVIVETDIGHLNPEGVIRKGSFLQFLYEDEHELRYLGVKVDHQEYLDEDDFRKHLGLSYNKKIYKACRVDFDDENKPATILIYDTNQTIAVYWWRDFLELKEINTDESNTRTAVTKVISKLGILKDVSPIDYTNLRNAVVTAFKQRDTVMRYLDFISQVIENYVPESDAAREKMPRLIESLKRLPEKHGFDTIFNLVPGAVTARARKYKLTEEIELVTKEGIENLNDKIWASESPDGKKLVIIHSDVGFNQFHFKQYS